MLHRPPSDNVSNTGVRGKFQALLCARCYAGFCLNRLAISGMAFGTLCIKHVFDNIAEDVASSFIAS